MTKKNKKIRQNKNVETSNMSTPAFVSRKGLPGIIIFLLCIVLYANTLTNDYTLDDSIAILQNEFTKNGFDGIKDILQNDMFTGFFGIQKNLVAGGRYRPLSLVTFAVEYEFFGENPFISHLVNILLYAFTCLILYSILKKLLQKYDNNRKWYLSVSFISTIIFVAHPLHTEVIANIKGRDEIMTLLGSLATLYYTLRYLDTKKTFFLFVTLIIFFLALMSKENAITFLAIIPFSVYFFTNYSLKQNLITLVPLFISTIAFLGIRQKMLGAFNIPETYELMNNPYVYAGTVEKYATIFYTWGIYIKLLLFPHPLTFDYYPKHIPIIDFSDARAILSMLFYVFIAIVAIAGFKKKKLVSYGILFFAASFSIVSNLFFNIGAFMNERFMYISSVGFCLIAAYFLVYGLSKLIKHEKHYSVTIIIILFVIIGLYSFKTISRNKIWKNDYVLFTNDVKISGNSAKSTCSAGGKIMEEVLKLRKIKKETKSFDNLKRRIEKETFLSNEEKQRITNKESLKEAKMEIDNMDKEMMQLSLKYLKKAVEIHPAYIDAILLLGNAHYEYNRNYKGVVDNYIKILKINPNYDRVYSNLEIVFNSCDDVDLKLKAWTDIYKINPDRFEVNYHLGNIYGRYKNDTKTAIPYLEKAVKLKPSSVKAYKDLGVAYGISAMYEKSIPVLEKAFELDPNDAQIALNLGITYRLTGDEKKAAEYFAKAQQIDPKFQIPQ